MTRRSRSTGQPISLGWVKFTVTYINEHSMGFTHPASIKVASAREPVLQSIGHLGNAPNHGRRIQGGCGFHGQVLDDHEVLLAAQDPNGEMAVGHPGVVLEQKSAVAIIAG